MVKIVNIVRSNIFYHLSQVREIKLFVFALFFLLLKIVAFSQTEKKQPNVIVILADDLGWADLQCYGSTFYETPNLDRLAKQGIQFMNGYASSPVCSPTRASLLTGSYPIKTGVTDWIKGRQASGKGTEYEKLVAQPINYNLPANMETIAQVALKNNYQTCIAGKWHLGEDEKHWPEAYGFQVNKGGFSKGSPAGFRNDTVGGFFTPYNNPRLSDGPNGEYITDRLTQESISFIESNKNKPFLLFYSMYAVHNPMQAPAELVKKYEQKKKQLNISDSLRFSKNEPWMKLEKGWKQRNIQDNAVYAAMIENMDQNIGKLLSKLEELKLADNTIVVFTSDNGGLSTAEGSPTTNGALRAGKGWLYEGGIRVPFIVKWPKLIRANQISDLPVNMIDIFPTLYTAITKKSVQNKECDGANIISLIKDKKQANSRTLYWHYPHYSNQGGKPSAAILQKGFKLILNYEDQSLEFYDLKKDIKEQKNIVGQHSVLTNRYHQKLIKWLTNNNAKFPKINPAYKTTIEGL